MSSENKKTETVPVNQKVSLVFNKDCTVSLHGQKASESHETDKGPL